MSATCAGSLSMRENFEQLASDIFNVRNCIKMQFNIDKYKIVNAVWATTSRYTQLLIRYIFQNKFHSNCNSCRTIALTNNILMQMVVITVIHNTYF